MCTVVGDYINIIKTTFNLNFNFLIFIFKIAWIGYTKTWKQGGDVNLKHVLYLLVNLLFEKTLLTIKT